MAPGLSRTLLFGLLTLWVVAAAASTSPDDFSWGPLPPGWQAELLSGEQREALPAPGRFRPDGRSVSLRRVISGSQPGALSAHVHIGFDGVVSNPFAQWEDSSAARNEGSDRGHGQLNGMPARYLFLPGSASEKRVTDIRLWLLDTTVGGRHPVVMTQLHCWAFTGPDWLDHCADLRKELDSVLAGIRVGAPPPSELRAYIEVPPDLKPGDVLSPSAVIVDEHGRTPAGEIALAWRIGGLQANSVIWDGKALAIRLDASADGQALTAELAVPAYGTGPPPAPPVRVGPLPGLTGIGELPGPRDATEGLTGMLGPAALGLLGAMLSGLLNAPPGPTPPKSPIVPKPQSRKRVRAAGTDGGTQDKEDEIGGEGDKDQPKPGKEGPGDKPGKEATSRRTRGTRTEAEPTGTGASDGSQPVRLGPDGRPLVPANPERAGRVQRAGEREAKALKEAEIANRPGRIFTDTLGRAGKEIVDATRTIADGARDAARTAGHFARGLREVVTDPKATAQALRAGVQGLADNLRTAGTLAHAGAVAAGEGLSAAAAAAKKAYHDPSLLTRAIAGLGAAAWDKLTAPGAIWGAIKNVTGLANFENAVDPKRTLLQRIGEVGSGVMKLYGAAQTAARVAAAAQRSAQGLAARLGGSAAAGQASARQGLGALAPRPPAGLDAAAAARQARAKESLRALAERPKPRMNARYVPTNQPPDLRGMPPANVRHAQVVADKYGAQIQIRPTNPDARRLLEGGAHPKPEFLKMKTINRDDILLGAPRDGVGKVGYFRPQLPPKGSVDPATYQRLEARALQRAKEFDDQAPKVAKLLNDKKIIVRPDGTVLNGKTGRPFAGDHDLFDIRGANGEPLPEAVRAQIRRELSRPPFNLQHPEHAAWDYSHLRRTLEAGESSSPYSIAQGVDQKILGSHQPGGEALITMAADRPPGSSFLSPPTPAPGIRGNL